MTAHTSDNETAKPKFGSELERLQWLYEKAPKGQKEAAAKRLRDYRTAMLKAEIGQRKAA